LYTLCFYNRKGGVGKTSVAGAISTELVIKGKKVLMVDADSQGNLSTQFLNGEEISAEFSSYLFDTSIQIENIIYKTPYDNLFIIPTKKNLSKSGLDAWISSESIKTENSDVISYLLEDVKKFGFDYVIFDMPPSFSELDKKILLACDEVTPVLQIAQTSLDGLATFYQRLQDLKKRKTKPICDKLIFNQQDKRKTVQKALLPTIEKLQTKTFFFPNDESFRKAELKGCALQELTIKKETQETLDLIIKDLSEGK